MGWTFPPIVWSDPTRTVTGGSCNPSQSSGNQWSARRLHDEVRQLRHRQGVPRSSPLAFAGLLQRWRAEVEARVLASDVDPIDRLEPVEAAALLDTARRLAQQAETPIHHLVRGAAATSLRTNGRPESRPVSPRGDTWATRPRPETGHRLAHRRDSRCAAARLTSNLPTELRCRMREGRGDPCSARCRTLRSKLADAEPATRRSGSGAQRGRLGTQRGLGFLPRDRPRIHVARLSSCGFGPHA